MAFNALCIWKGLLLVSLLFLSVHGQASGPSFMVTFPAMIESGSEAKLCASLLKPNESLVMNIYLVHGDQSTLLLQEKAEEEFHRCFNIQTPLVEAESVQTMKVELQGKNFKMTEERKVMLRRYNHLTFIQTDKPIYIPGQTVNFRVVTMDRNFVPFDQKDNQNNRIGQWKNISSTRWILQLSHELNPEARQGIYKLMAYIGERAITHYFEVKKYVLPKFEITMKAPKEITFGDSDMNMEVCGKYTFGKPVAGKARVEVCREHLRYISQTDLISPCLVETTEMSAMGCASFTLDTLAFFNSTNDRFLKEHLTVKVNVTEEGTENTMEKSETISLTYEIGKAMFTELPKIYEHGSIIQGKSDFFFLPALSLYATKVFSSDGSSTVTVQSAGDTHHFDVNQDNKLLYQEKQLQNVPAKYSIEAKGSACVSVQVAQFYNIPTPTEVKTLSIDAKIEGDCKTLGQNFILSFTVKYDGRQERTNMVIVDIKLLSGFTADTSMLGTSGTYASLVERVDAKDDHVILYLKEIPKNIQKNYQIQMKQVLPVKNLKPAVVKVYDYYQTSKILYATVESPLHSSVSLEP
uniref:Alpha-macroglobulin receptor-binding domain-containing protein n=1 Tax=Sinocyclocheilus anshuiensis TaxID=1608454 RepID=A0A671RI67_9TELE